MDRPKVTRIGDIRPNPADMPLRSIDWTEIALSRKRCKPYPTPNITGITRARVMKGEIGTNCSTSTAR